MIVIRRCNHRLCFSIADAIVSLVGALLLSFWDLDSRETDELEMG
jgi:hypothetical protein